MKSLNLPGTYHEKISDIGTSLQRFIYLQHLDLSKNNISSLKVLFNVVISLQTIFITRIWFYLYLKLNNF